jgi:hypothetical protein
VSMPKPNLTMTKSSVTQKTRATILLRNLIVASHRKAWGELYCLLRGDSTGGRKEDGNWGVDAVR